MPSDFDKPTVDGEYTNILPEIRENQEALALMFSQGNESNIPTGAVRFLNNQFYTWNGASWDAKPIGVGGGGTGSSTAATARTALGTNDATNIDTGTLSAGRVPVLAIDTKTSGILPGGRVDQGNTSQRGTVQLNDTLTSVSTTEALTAARGKHLEDNKFDISNDLSEVSDVVAARQNLGVFVGRVTSGGVANLIPIGWSINYHSTGVYSVTHNLSTLNYAVLLTAFNGFYASFDTIGSSSFFVYTFDDAGAASDAAFHFNLMRL